MPEFLERKLRSEARAKGFSGRRADAYVYGTENEVGAMHGNKETARGREMEKKHEAKMNNLHSMRIEIHRGKGNAVTGHTVHHEMMPKPSKSGAFSEQTHESYPFDADGQSSSHGDMLAHIGKHLELTGDGAPAEAAEEGEA